MHGTVCSKLCKCFRFFLVSVLSCSILLLEPLLSSSFSCSGHKSFIQSSRMLRHIQIREIDTLTNAYAHTWNHFNVHATASLRKCNPVNSTYTHTPAHVYQRGFLSYSLAFPLRLSVKRCKNLNISQKVYISLTIGRHFGALAPSHACSFAHANAYTHRENERENMNTNHISFFSLSKSFFLWKHWSRSRRLVRLVSSENEFYNTFNCQL